MSYILNTTITLEKGKRRNKARGKEKREKKRKQFRCPPKTTLELRIARSEKRRGTVKSAKNHLAGPKKSRKKTRKEEGKNSRGIGLAIFGDREERARPHAKEKKKRERTAGTASSFCGIEKPRKKKINCKRSQPAKEEGEGKKGIKRIQCVSRNFVVTNQTSEGERSALKKKKGGQGAYGVGDVPSRGTNRREKVENSWARRKKKKEQGEKKKTEEKKEGKKRRKTG